MKENCLIILDSSGSMNEEGKRAAGEYLLRAMAGFIRDYFPGLRCGAYSWGEGIVRYGDKSVEDSVRLDAGALSAFVEEHRNTPVILISDGIFSKRENKALLSLSGNDCIRVVMVGADANLSTLRRIFSESRVFESVDAIECVRQLLMQR